MGDREEKLMTAVKELAKNLDVKVEALSSIYETEPVGFVDRGPIFKYGS